MFVFELEPHLLPGKFLNQYEIDRRDKELLRNIIYNEKILPQYASFDIRNILKGNIVTSTENSVNVNGLFDMLSLCYSMHRDVLINPHDIWFLIQTQVVKLINNEPDVYKSYFTSSSSNEKEKLYIPTNDITTVDPILILQKLQDKVTFDYNVFLRHYSTSTPMVVLAGVAAFAEAASNYYSYMTYCCGLPKVTFGGTMHDWDWMSTHCVELANVFDPSTSVYKYLYRVMSLCENLYAAIKNNNIEYVRNIFTQKNVGSGGELIIDGWITEFFSDIETIKLKKLENFTGTYTKIPYQNLETGRRFKALYGGFEMTKDENNNYSLTYKSYILEEFNK